MYVHIYTEVEKIILNKKQASFKNSHYLFFDFLLYLQSNFIIFYMILKIKSNLTVISEVQVATYFSSLPQISDRLLIKCNCKHTHTRYPQYKLSNA